MQTDDHAMPGRAARMRARLIAVFDPVALEVQDDSARHAGHGGAAPGGETHFNVSLVSAAFHGRSRVERSRAVHEALRSEFAEGLHALSLVLKSDKETAGQGLGDKEDAS